MKKNPGTIHQKWLLIIMLGQQPNLNIVIFGYND